MLIEEYFQSIGGHITDCPYVAELQIRHDKRSFYIGVVEGEIRFTDNSFLHFIEFVNVKEGVKRYKYSYHYQDKAEKQFVEDILKEKVLEFKKRLFVRGAADIRRKLALKDLTEEEIIAEFERLRHSQSGSPVS